MDTKHLIKLYSEYKKIGQPKGYYEGQEVKNPVSSPTTSPTPSPGPVLPGAKSFQEGFKKGYADGGDVQSDDRRYRSDIGDYMNDDEYNDYKTRMQTAQAKDVTDRQEMQQYAQKAKADASGSSLDNSDSVDAIKQQIASNPNIGAGVMQAPSPTTFGNANKQAFNPNTVQQKFDGGKIKKDVPHNKNNLEELKKAFSKFLEEEGKEKYSKGGKVKGYADGSDPEDPSDISNDKSKMDLGDIPINSKEDELPEYRDEETDAGKVVDEKKALEDELDKESDDSKDESDDKESADEDKKDSEEQTETKDLSPEEQQDIENQGFTSKSEGIPSQLGSPEALAAAQKQRQNMMTGAAVTQFGNLAGAGIAGQGGARTQPLPSSYFDSLKAGAQLPVQNIEEQLGNQGNDPNSAVSKVVRDYYKSKGINIPDNASANNVKQIAPYYMKDATLQNAMQKALLKESGANKRKAEGIASNEGIANKKLEVEKQKADAATVNASSNKDLKAQASQDRALQQTKQMLESARGNPAAAQAEKDMYSVDKANSLFNLYPDLDKIPDAQVGLITQEIAKVATGGVPPGHEIDAIKPGTPESKLTKLYGQLVNSPQPANLGAYLKELKNYTGALGKDAKKVIQDKYGRVIESSKKQLGDDNYKTLQDQYVGRFNPKAESTKNHPQDDEAVAWAKKNPNDPRADKILKANGEQ